MIRQILVSLLAAFSLSAFAAVDANRATQAELETVKGIGPGLSAKILKVREAGAFKDWSDMVQRVPGVGVGNAAKMSQAGLTVGGVPFERGARSAAPKVERKPVAPADKPADKPARKPAKNAGE